MFNAFGKKNRWKLDYLEWGKKRKAVLFDQTLTCASNSPEQAYNAGRFRAVTEAVQERSDARIFRDVPTFTTAPAAHPPDYERGWNDQMQECMDVRASLETR